MKRTGEAVSIVASHNEGSAAGRFGGLLMTSGVFCLGGLAVGFFTMAGHSGWGVLHNQTGLFLLGVASILGTPFWLLGAAIAALSTKAPWRAHEVALVLLVLFSLLATVAAYTTS